MVWNWQQPDWPNFSWDEARLRKAEEQFLVGTGVLVGALKHLPESDHEQLTVESISIEAVTTLFCADFQETESGRLTVPVEAPPTRSYVAAQFMHTKQARKNTGQH